jgi:hypothetical protein
MKRHFWTTRETSVVRDNYPHGGLDACEPLLPNRTRASIYQQAMKMGLRAPGQLRLRMSWPKDPFIDASIRATYEKVPERQDVVKLAERIGRPRWWVSKRARELGLVGPRFKESAWTDDELELLTDNAHMSLPVLARKFRAKGWNRTETAIKLKLKRLHISRIESRREAGLYSANQVALFMGVDGKTVTRWINLKMLEALRRGTDRDERQGGDEWVVNIADLRRFVVENPQSIDLRKVDKHWFIEEIVGSKAA